MELSRTPQPRTGERRRWWRGLLREEPLGSLIPIPSLAKDSFHPHPNSAVSEIAATLCESVGFGEEHISYEQTTWTENQRARPSLRCPPIPQSSLGVGGIGVAYWRASPTSEVEVLWWTQLL